MLREIEAALEEFTPKQRRRFLLHFAYGYIYLEIAKMEGSNKSTVMRSAKTALKKFKKAGGLIATFTRVLSYKVKGKNSLSFLVFDKQQAYPFISVFKFLNAVSSIT